MRIVFAPIPFPLLQLSRTWVFLWVFTLPLSLETDSAGIFARCFIVFFLTFAYLGLEFMSIQLEDPLGSDDNDVNCLNICRGVMEDIYNIIDEVDGGCSATEIWEKMKSDDEMESTPPTETTFLLECGSSESLSCDGSPQRVSRTA